MSNRTPDFVVASLSHFQSIVGEHIVAIDFTEQDNVIDVYSTPNTEDMEMFMAALGTGLPDAKILEASPLLWNHRLIAFDQSMTH